MLTEIDVCGWGVRAQALGTHHYFCFVYTIIANVTYVSALGFEKRDTNLTKNIVIFS